MMSAALSSDVHLIWYVVLAVPIIHLIVSLVNIVMMQSRSITAQLRGTVGLQVSLRAEIAVILRTVGENIERLRAKSDCVMSLRPLAIVYRGNTARLSVLRDDQNAEIVRVYGHLEYLDAKVCSFAKQQGGLAYKLNPDGLSPAALLLELIDLRCDLEKLAKLLEPDPEMAARAAATFGDQYAAMKDRLRVRSLKAAGPLLPSSREKAG